MGYETDETYEPFRDDTYRAIGRYVVEFSRIFTLMRDKMSYRLARPEDTREPLETALGEMTAAQLTNAFFATCASIGHLDDDERKVGRCYALASSRRASDETTSHTAIGSSPKSSTSNPGATSPSYAASSQQRARTPTTQNQ
jgi:hypothetical protein